VIVNQPSLQSHDLFQEKAEPVLQGCTARRHRRLRRAATASGVNKRDADTVNVAVYFLLKLSCSIIIQLMYRSYTQCRSRKRRQPSKITRTRPDTPASMFVSGCQNGRQCSCFTLDVDFPLRLARASRVQPSLRPATPVRVHRDVRCVISAINVGNIMMYDKMCDGEPSIVHECNDDAIAVDFPLHPACVSMKQQSLRPYVQHRPRKRRQRREMTRANRLALAPTSDGECQNARQCSCFKLDADFPLRLTRTSITQPSLRPATPVRVHRDVRCVISATTSET
jgi:hypothetical protein